jgi:hypothetical protein
VSCVDQAVRGLVQAGASLVWFTYITFYFIFYDDDFMILCVVACVGYIQYVCVGPNKRY